MNNSLIISDNFRVCTSTCDLGENLVGHMYIVSGHPLVVSNHLALPYVVAPTQICAHRALSVTRDSNSYFKGYFDNDPEVVVVEPGYFQTLNRLIKVTDRRVLANYVIGDYVMECAHQLDERFADIRYVCEISLKSYCGIYVVVKVWN